jgi:uncharacterized protein
VKVVDANVLLYAVNTSAPHHSAARDWLDKALNGAETVGFTWVALIAFLRISTHPGIFPEPLSPDAAFEVAQTWLAQPTAVVIEPTARHLGVLRGLLSQTGTAGNLVNDAFIAAVAIEHGAVVASFDTNFQRFPGVRRFQPA